MEFSYSKQKLSNDSSYWLQSYICQRLQEPMRCTVLALSMFLTQKECPHSIDKF